MPQMPLTLADQDRIALHVELLSGFFKKIALFSGVIFPAVLLYLYYDGHLMAMGEMKYAIIGLFIIAPFIEYNTFRVVVGTLGKQLRNNIEKSSITGMFNGTLQIRHNGKQQKAADIITSDGTTHTIPLQGLVTILSGQQDDVLNAIAQFQAGQTVTIEYLTKPDFVLNAH